MNLELEDAVGILRVIDLLDNLLSFGVQAVLEEGLGIVEFVALVIRIELGELVVHLACLLIVLDIEVAVREQR